MLKAIEKIASCFIEKVKNKKVRIISHHDTDGITSVAIIAKTLIKLDMPFSIKIIKQLEKSFFNNNNLSKDKFYIFLDLGSNYLDEISKLNAIVIDHHEISSDYEIYSEIGKLDFINPHIFNEELSTSCLAYLFSKQLAGKDKELASLAVIGMVGDVLDKEISPIANTILKEAEVEIRKGLLLYPATRPINKTLEFNSSFFIPGATGNSKGVYSLLRECGIKKESGKYPCLLELNSEEISKLLTSILPRIKKELNIIGNIYLLKFFNKIEDARELSAMINACSRLGHSNIALSLCLNNKKEKKKAEALYISYKQYLISALNYANNTKIEGKNYIIINAKNHIKDTIIGTIASILSKSSQLNEGTTIVTMAYDKDKIKASVRISGNGRNARKLFENIVNQIGGECGGHQQAAGCLISKKDENKFLELLQKQLKIEIVKV